MENKNYQTGNSFSEHINNDQLFNAEQAGITEGVYKELQAFGRENS